MKRPTHPGDAEDIELQVEAEEGFDPAEFLACAGAADLWIPGCWGMKPAMWCPQGMGWLRKHRKNRDFTQKNGDFPWYFVR